VLFQRVDEYWARVFGSRVADLWSPGCSVSVSDMPGVYVLVRGQACRIAAPAAMAAALADVTRDLGADDALDPGRWPDLLPGVGSVLGPSVHAYLDSPAGLPDPDGVVEVDRGALAGLRDACQPTEWGEAGFGHTGRLFALYEGGTVVAAGNLTDWRNVPSDVGLVTHPDQRGRGYGLRVGAHVSRIAIAEAGIARYRALAGNVASRHIARRLGFVEYGSNLTIRLTDNP